MYAIQLDLLRPREQEGPAWSHEGVACTSCSDGQMYMVHPSDPCACTHALCDCLAEGYARCDSCGALQQVWPREMVARWVPGKP